MVIKKAGIIGLGLIGGSLAKALKKRCDVNEIIAYNREEKPLILAKQEKIADVITDQIDNSFSDCDIVFICTPVNRIFEYAQTLSKFVKKECILTDVGSTKNTIMEQISNIDGICFIGGHPMAGSEKTGYKAAKEHLFENAYYILTPSLDADTENIAILQQLVLKLGAIPIVMDAKEHDYAVAGISHVPHVIASALVNTVNKIDCNKFMHNLAAGGFKDITRIASSSPDIWASISFENKNEILRILTTFQNEINHFKEKLEANNETDLMNFFASAKSYRDSFKTSKISSFIKSYEIIVDIVDKPGSIATLATMLSVNNINIKNIGILNNREYENGVLQILFDKKEDMEKSVQLIEALNFFVYKKL